MAGRAQGSRTLWLAGARLVNVYARTGCSTRSSSASVVLIPASDWQLRASTSANLRPSLPRARSDPRALAPISISIIYHSRTCVHPAHRIGTRLLRTKTSHEDFPQLPHTRLRQCHRTPSVLLHPLVCAPIAEHISRRECCSVRNRRSTQRTHPVLDVVHPDPLWMRSVQSRRRHDRSERRSRQRPRG